MADTKLSELPNTQAIKAASGAVTFDGEIGSVTPAAGTFTKNTVDNLVIDGNTISSSSGDINIAPVAGSKILFDGIVTLDAGVIAGATSITSTAFVGNITGNVTGNASGTAATVTGAAQAAITSVGTLTALDVDNININGNTIKASTGAVNITPEAGSAIVLDGAINIDAGVVTGATSITSTSFTGALTGNASTVTTNANLTGVVTSVGNATSIASQTGTGTKFVVDTSPTLVTPILGVAAVTSINKVAITTPATSATITIADGKTFTASNTLTLTGTDSSTITLGAGGTVAYIGTAQTWTQPQTFTNSDIILLGSSTGANTFTALNAGASNYTTSVPAVTGVLATTTGANLYYADIKRCGTPLTKNADTALANIPDLTQTVVPGTYVFRCVLYSTVASGTAGIKYAFNYTTAVLSSLAAASNAFIAAGAGCQSQTSTTTQAVLYGQAALIIKTVIEGSMVVTTGGTIDLQMAQQVSNGSDTTVNIGSTMEFVRIS